MSAYVAPLPSASPLPEHLRVRVVVTRADGRPLTAEDLAAAVAAYPPAAEDREAVARSVDAAATAAKGKPAKPRAKPRGGKRAAAKRPAKG